MVTLTSTLADKHKSIKKGCDRGMDVGTLIKQARLEKGYTQEELAEKVGVKKSAVAKWENGRVSEIKRSNLKMLSEALDLKPTQLLGDSGYNLGPYSSVEELSENQRKLIDFALTVPEDKAAMILKVIQSIVESD
jgi:transcriptional regulator with XRE-family HTH domain